MNRTKLVRYDYYKGPNSLGDAWSLVQGALTMQCALKTHRLGWELRLTAGKNLLRSQVCKTETEVFDTADAWQAEAIAKGWTTKQI